MQRAWDVLGLPVLALDTGEAVGGVRDILMDSSWRVVGFLLQEDGWFHAGRFIPLRKVHNVGEDCLTVEGADAIASTRVLSGRRTLRFATGADKLKGKTVVTADGTVLGWVEDVYFSRGWEKLVGYELSDGWVADLARGRKKLPAPLVVAAGDSLIVPDSPRMKAGTVQGG